MIIEFILSSLAIWRICSLLVNEEGPYEIFHKLRLKVDNYSDVLRCIWCLSIWISIPFAIYLVDGVEILIYILALSSTAIIIDAIIEQLEI